MQKEPAVAKMFALMSAAQRSDATPDHIREMANKGISVIEQFVPVVLWGQKEGTIREVLIHGHQLHMRNTAIVSKGLI